MTFTSASCYQDQPGSCHSTPMMIATPSSMSTVGSISSDDNTSSSSASPTTAATAATSASPLAACTTTLDQDSIVHIIRTMRSKESSYRTSDYLLDIAQSPDFSPEWIDEDCRSKMCTWCIQIVEHCGDTCFSRDTVAIAMNILDRYLAKTDSMALQCRSTFQMTCVTAFYTAVKVHEQCAISAETLSILSKNMYTVQQLEATERQMLQTIGWAVHPRTGRMFAKYMMDLLPETSGALQDYVEAQMDYAMQEYQFVGVDASMIAMASILNGLVACDSQNMTDQKLLQIEQLLAYAAQLPCQSTVTRDLQQRLFLAIAGVQDDHIAAAAVAERIMAPAQTPTNTNTNNHVTSYIKTTVSGSVEHSPTSTVRI